MYLGERFASVVWTWGGSTVLLFLGSGMVEIWGGTQFGITLTESDAGVALLHTVFGGVALVAVWTTALAYLRDSPEVASGRRVTPVVHMLEDADAPNTRLQLAYADALFLIWAIFALLFAIQIYDARIYDGADHGGTPLADGAISSRLAALRRGLPAFWGQVNRLGENGVDYVPVLTDIVPPVLWIAVTWLYVSWRRRAHPLATNFVREKAQA